MKKRRLNIIALMIALAIVAPFSSAQDSGASLAAHVHGLSELAIAMEGENLEIQLTSPAMNLVGFEHKARSVEDISAIENADSMLRQHEALFVFSNGRCDLVQASIDLTGLIESDDHEYDHQKTEHKHANEHTKEHEEHEEHANKDNHSDVVANYEYHCENIAQLSALTVDVFQSFPGIQKMNVVWVKSMHQGAATLTPKHHIIEFR